MKKEITIKSIAIVVSIIVLISLIGGWGVVFETFGQFIKFVIFLGVAGLIGWAIIGWWKNWGKKI